MASQGKRKDVATGATGPQGKKKKRGNEGKWKTPHYQAMTSGLQDGNVVPGDVGIWLTCARGQEKKAVREVTDLFGEYAETIYGIKQDEEGGGDSDDDEDIEAAVKREVESMKTNGGNSATRLFTPVKLNIECVVFIKTKPPIEPVDFVKRICEGAKGGDTRKTRYVNRLTPVVMIGKATEQGIVEVARKVLSPWFDLSGKRAGAGAGAEAGAEAVPVDSDKPNEGAGSGLEQSANGPDEASNDAEGLGENPAEHPAQDAVGVEASRSYSFAIRPSIRRNATLKQLAVINQIADLINDDRHKVNLEAPDKVILVDIFQKVCGMSVVDGDWDDLKRYNLSELHSLANEQGNEES